MLLEVMRELVDALHSLKGITDNRRAELHALLDQAAGETAPAERAPKPAPVKADVPADA